MKKKLLQFIRMNHSEFQFSTWKCSDDSVLLRLPQKTDARTYHVSHLSTT